MSAVVTEAVARSTDVNSKWCVMDADVLVVVVVFEIRAVQRAVSGRRQGAARTAAVVRVIVAFAPAGWRDLVG